MKRILIIMAAVICLCSCAKIIDWVPVTFQVRVQDAQGKDLLDPADDNSWLIGTEIHFRGITVNLDETGISPVTRDLPAEYRGFRLEKGSDYYYLAFGEFEGGADYDEEDMMIQWPDGKVNVITYSRKLNRVKADAKQVFKLDGVECSNPIIIVR